MGYDKIQDNPHPIDMDDEGSRDQVQHDTDHGNDTSHMQTPKEYRGGGLHLATNRGEGYKPCFQVV
jgi:hypothetical protein